MHEMVLLVKEFISVQNHDNNPTIYVHITQCSLHWYMCLPLGREVPGLIPKRDTFS